MPFRPTICLCMIVKDEASVIRRCLESVRPLLDHWIVVDTGSTDGTQDIVRATLADVPGEVVERPWRDFAHNRSEALRLARPHGDYSFIIDADDTVTIAPGFTMPVDGADMYLVDIHSGPLRHQRVQMVRNALEWSYVGVLHEVVHCPSPVGEAHLPGVTMHVHRDGARRKDPERFRKDAQVLERALETEESESLRSRYAFYLAQSWRDAHEPEKAVAAYLRRAEMRVGWDEEVYVSLWQAAMLEHGRGASLDRVVGLLLRAADVVPQRVETLYEAARLCRLAGRHAEGYAIALRGRGRTLPARSLFVEPYAYEVGILDELSVTAYWEGYHAESLEAAVQLLASPATPKEQLPRHGANAQAALAKLGLAGRARRAPIERSGGRHELAPARSLRSAIFLAGPTSAPPKVLVAILARQMETALPLYLRCIEALDYPKTSIVLSIRTNDNTDRTREVLEAWLTRVATQYAAVELADGDIPEHGASSAERSRVLGRIRRQSRARAAVHGCAYYFASDVDNFVRACTLRELVALGMPIVAPHLRHVDPASRDANYHADVDDAEGLPHRLVFDQTLTGVIEVPLVRGTYLVRADVIPALDDDDGRLDDAARRRGIAQYYDNRQLYGYLTRAVSPEHLAAAERLLAGDVRAGVTA